MNNNTPVDLRSHKPYIIRIAMLLIGIQGIVFSSAYAYQSNNLWEIYNSSTSRSSYIIFTAREGFPGHAFVILGEELDNGLMWDHAVFGFYPKDGKKLFIRALIGTPGKVDYKWSDLERDVFHRVNISEETKGKILYVLIKWLGVDYTLFDKNCNKFISEVADAIGLTLPAVNPGNTLPVNYLKKLIKAQEPAPPSPPVILPDGASKAGWDVSPLRSELPLNTDVRR
ncbi:MAG: hypothetical protein AB2809_13685 [Candidatus Thiodiazotropha sp.]